MRLYLHIFGERAEGTVIESLLKHSFVSGNELSTSRFVDTRYLTVEYTGPDHVKRIVKGRSYSNGGGKGLPQVGGSVPVLYCRFMPGFAVFYDKVWHYLVPFASLFIALLLTFAATRVCYEDIRAANALAIADSTREHFEEYNKVIIEGGLQINDASTEAGVYERRGDALFANMQFGDAVKDYSEALRLGPDGRRDLVLKRAKAAWLDGRDFDALRDWLQYRRL
ncbi:MAG: hypothetical protein KKG47_01220 [Proteobacteria bacterium]|nr:hypothetical protein [Pseudomonadota bacterium]MBU1736687.1 hypothetical protein [Pseudomonadota bacterium]